MTGINDSIKIISRSERILFTAEQIIYNQIGAKFDQIEVELILVEHNDPCGQTLFEIRVNTYPDLDGGNEVKLCSFVTEQRAREELWCLFPPLKTHEKKIKLFPSSVEEERILLDFC